MSEGALDLLVMRSCSTFKNLCAVLYDVQNLLTFARNRRSPFEPHLRQTLTQYKQITSFGKCLGGNCLLRPGRTGRRPPPTSPSGDVSVCIVEPSSPFCASHSCRRDACVPVPAFQSVFRYNPCHSHGDLLSASKRRRRCQKSLPRTGKREVPRLRHRNDRA